MNRAASPTTKVEGFSAHQTFTSQARMFLVGALFAAVLLIPKVIHLRRSHGPWMTFRIVLGVVGAALVILPIGLGNSYVLAVVGLGAFIAAILLPPARPHTSADDRARELGALVIVNGGRYQPGNAPATTAKLFVGAENVWALDPHLQPLLVIPVAEMQQAFAEEGDGGWRLRIQWADRAAEFSFGGFFAEHLTRVAESTLQSVMRPALPVIPQRRAASA